MALEVSCQVKGPATSLSVRQSGSDDGVRWQRYYRLISRGWESSLEALKQYLEGKPLKTDPHESKRQQRK